MRETQTVIIGAGPYGLSLAAHLSRSKVEHRIFGRPMQFWEQTAQAGSDRYLKSYCFGTNLATPAPGYAFRDYNAPRGLETYEPCSIANFADYGRWFQAQNVPWVEPVDVARVTSRASGFGITLVDGTKIVARSVVVATGLSFFQSVPQILADLSAQRVTHTADVKNFSAFAGQKVAVVGAGQSALEAAALLHEAGAFPQLIVREPAIRWNSRAAQTRSLWQRIRSPISVLGTGPKAWALARFPGAMHRLPSNLRRRFLESYLPAEGAWWLRPRVESVVPIQLASTVVAASETAEGVVLAIKCAQTGDVAQILVDHVVAGTGYKIDVTRIPFLDAELAARIAVTNGAPRLNAVFETSVPGLHFVGPISVPSFGPLFRFVVGASYTSQVLCKHLAQTAPSPVPEKGESRFAGELT